MIRIPARLDFSFSRTPAATPIAGKGDIPNPCAWQGNTPTLGIGSLTTVPFQGDFTAAGYTQPGDPDNATALISFEVATPTLGEGSLPAIIGKGDIGDVLGSTQNSDTGQGVYALIAWDVSTPTLELGLLASVTPQSVPVLGVGPLISTPTPGQGDIMQQSIGGDGFLPVFVWIVEAPTLGLGAIEPVIGKGDIPNPYAWEDSDHTLPPTEWFPQTRNGQPL